MYEIDIYSSMEKRRNSIANLLELRLMLLIWNRILFV